MQLPKNVKTSQKQLAQSHSPPQRLCQPLVQRRPTSPNHVHTVVLKTLKTACSEGLGRLLSTKGWEPFF